MEVLILDENFKSFELIDVFESLLWTERYNSCGDFEIYTPVSEQSLTLIQFILEKRKSDLDIYVWKKDTDCTMVLETCEITTSDDEGSHVIISGRSLESLLDRRIIWSQTVLNGNLQSQIKKLLDENVINSINKDRRFPNFIFEESDDPQITSQTIQAQYTGDNLYDVICGICKDYQIGFRVRLTNENKMAFKLYAGVDRSYEQSKNPYVVFSSKFENIADTNYLESVKTLKNLALVAGEDSGVQRRMVAVGKTNLGGLSRREMYVDARDIQSETTGGEIIPDEEYMALLRQRGNECLSENVYTKTFEGNVEAKQNFVYGKDFFKGDIVQIVTDYGVESKVRVSEFIQSQNNIGYNTYPTFESIS